MMFFFLGITLLSTTIQSIYDLVLTKVWNCVNYTMYTPGRRQSKTFISSTNEDQNSQVRKRVFDFHLSPDWRQMAIKNTVSSDF